MGLQREISATMVWKVSDAQRGGGAVTKHNSGKSESSKGRVPIPVMIVFCLALLFFLGLSVHYYVIDLNRFLKHLSE